MNLNLRKARKLETKISQHVSKTSLSTTTEVRIKSALGEAAIALENAKNEFEIKLAVLLKLNKVRYSIRQKIAEANSKVDITRLMTIREELVSQQELLTAVQIQGTSPSGAELADLLEANKAKLEKGGDSYSRLSVNVELNVVTQEQQDLIKKTKLDNIKLLEDIEDQLAQKNLGAEITLSEEELALLQANNLL